MVQHKSSARCTTKGFTLPADQHDTNTDQPSQKKATLVQVAATMFWGLCMIGKKGTWERDGAKITLRQAIIGAVLAGCVVVSLLLLLARLATH